MSAMIRACVTSFVLVFVGVALAGCNDDGAWPPRAGKPFPGIEFTNYDGRKIRFSDFKGKVVLFEPVGMTCEACNALSGGHEQGGIGDIKPQQGLQTIEEYLGTYGGGTSLDDGNVVLVQVLLYDLAMEAPDIDDARIWAEHFGLDGNPNIYVVFSARDLRGRASFKMIPGFQLIDKTSVVRFDSTGHRKRHNLFTQLLPAVPQMARN